MSEGVNQKLPKHKERSLPGVPEAQGLTWLITCLVADDFKPQVAQTIQVPKPSVLQLITLAPG